MTDIILVLLKVNFAAGVAVAIVLAENRGAALDAAELVDVDYEPLPAVTAAVDALADEAPQLHAGARGNVCFRWQRGDAAAVERAFAQAAHTVELQLHNNRLAGCAIEPRAAVALPGPDGDSLTLYSATQVPHFVRRLVAEQLGLVDQRDAGVDVEHVGAGRDLDLGVGHHGREVAALELLGELLAPRRVDALADDAERLP